MTPEAKAREHIDRKLAAAGWLVQDFKQANFSAAPGVAVREYPTDTGPADYVLFVNRNEAGQNLSAHEAQTGRLRLMKDHIAASGCITRTDFDYATLAAQGGLQRVWGLFGGGWR